MRGSLIAVLFFAVGLTAGHCDYLPTWTTDSRISFAALCGLLLFVGIGIGLNPNMKNDIKSLSPRLALLPIATILGSWLGAMAAYLAISSGVCPLLETRSITDCMAINSGFAYYSLSSIFITEYRGAELGTIALLANVIRELITLLLTPLIAKRFGPLAPISSGGATTMDTTLPIIIQTPWLSDRLFCSFSCYHVVHALARHLPTTLLPDCCCKPTNTFLAFLSIFT